ncbi:MAG: RrF2 family transcriptional regulator [Paludibacteraceae bacterium]
MKINTKIRYGLRTMIEIASCHDSNGILQKDIAKKQNISVKYLDYIISALKLKGLISNTKGRGSGYVITRPPDQISMFDIYTAFEQIVIVECVNNKSFCERATHCCKAINYWKGFSRDVIELLSNKNLEQIINETHYECINCED